MLHRPVESAARSRPLSARAKLAGRAHSEALAAGTNTYPAVGYVQISDQIADSIVRQFLETMFLRHLAYHAARRWNSWRSAFNSAQFSTTLWLGCASGLGLTACLAALTGILPRQLNPLLAGPDWLWSAMLFPVFLVCDHYVEKITDRYKSPTSADQLEQYKPLRERLIWLAQSFSTLAMFFLMCWLHFLATK